MALTTLPKKAMLLACWLCAFPVESPATQQQWDDTYASTFGVHVPFPLYDFPANPGSMRPASSSVRRAGSSTVRMASDVTVPDLLKQTEKLKLLSTVSENTQRTWSA